MKILYSFLARIVNAYHSLRYYNYKKQYNLNSGFRFNGTHIYFYGKGKLAVGTNSYIGSFSTIQLHEDCMVSIGNGCSISHNVRMYTSSKLPDYDFSDKNNVPEKKGNIEIGNYVWIGANVFINPGIKIGDNSVIGANSVITKDILPNGIYGGVPAKLIRMKRNHA